MTDPEIEQALLLALRPLSWKERAHWLSVGGLTLSQLMDRLPGDITGPLKRGQGNPVVARRMVMDALMPRLVALYERGLVRRTEQRVGSALVYTWRPSLSWPGVTWRADR